MLVLSILAVSTICVLFSSAIGKKMAAVLQKTSLFERINSLFLSDHDRRYFDLAERIEKASPEVLRKEFESLICRYGRRYASSNSSRSDQLSTALPDPVSVFFSGCDYLAFDDVEHKYHLLDVKTFARRCIGGEVYYIIGCDVEEDTWFLVRDRATGDTAIYGISSRYADDGRDSGSGTDIDIAFRSIEHLVVFYGYERSDSD